MNIDTANLGTDFPMEEGGEAVAFAITSADGRFYTGRAGQSFLDTDRAQAFRFSSEAAALGRIERLPSVTRGIFGPFAVVPTTF